MEHPHDRHRPVERLDRLFEEAWARLSRRDEQDLEEFGFLHQAGEDIPGALERMNARLKKTLAVSAGLCAVLFLLFALPSRNSAELSGALPRPAYGEPDASRQLVLSLDWQDARWEQEVQVDLPAMEVTHRQAQELFDSCERWLNEEVFGSVRSLERVTEDLKLPEQSPKGLVRILWSSSDPGRIDPGGAVNMTGAKDGTAVELAAELCAGEYVRRLVWNAVLMPGAAKDIRPSLQAEAEGVLQDLPESLSADSQILPERSAHGAGVSWSLPKAGLPWEIPGSFLLLALFLLFSRTDSLKRHLKDQKAALEREIPNMSLQMILLLNAGLTVDSAFSRLIRENAGRSDPLYRAFISLQEESRATNLPFVNALYVYARQSGIRDLIRFSSLALDCSGRGSELAEKLDKERQQLWNDRLNRAKARAREAETKLCLPLMILLLVLVVIAIAPAFMEM